VQDPYLEMGQLFRRLAPDTIGTTMPVFPTIDQIIAATRRSQVQVRRQVDDQAAERAVAVHTEPLAASHHGELRLHCEDGPAVAFGDGYGIHVLHGTAVPEWVLAGPSVDLIRREPNVEVRRSAIERIGWDTYIRQAALSPVATCPDPGNPGAALSLYDDLADDRGFAGRVLLVVNGTPEPDGHRRRYGINVPAIFDDPVDAAGWTYGLDGRQYAQLARRT